MVRARLALAKSFLESFSRLPKKQQKKVWEKTDLFVIDPTSPGLNFERLPGMRDEKVRSLRVDRSYRMIIVQPPKGDVFLAVWVDNHDEAYQWAEKKTFEVNPVSGVMQVYSVEEGQAAMASLEEEFAEPAPSAAPLFVSHEDDDLLLAGVPQPLLPSVRGILTDHDLDALAPHLPSDASEMLYLLASGYTFQDALEEASRPVLTAGVVDTSDFGASLERDLSQESFHVVEGEEDLERVLDAPLEQWRVFLHPSQRRIVQMDANGPVRVLGGAGTGKTVVLMHRARHLAASLFQDPDDRILVTTFTRNLASDIEDSLGKLCPELMDRLEVRSLHSWARSYYERAVGSRVRILLDERREQWMEDAIAVAGEPELPARFYLDEWDQVVLAKGIDSEATYLRARRVGRGTPLARSQRKSVWRVFETYRERLREGGWHEWQDIIREVRMRLESDGVRKPFSALLADEIQDFSEQELLLLRALVSPKKADLFLVGDAHQRIYGQMTSLGRCGIEIRGRSRRLRLNYRTTEQIRARAISVLEGVDIDDLDEGVDDFTGYKSLRSGPAPEVRLFERPDEEQRAVVETLHRWLECTLPTDVCVAARTHAALERYTAILDQVSIPYVQVKREATAATEGVRLATMHRLKGLEFKRVMLVSVHEGCVPLELPDASFSDDASREDHDRRERCLFYVASTRARDELVITGFGRRSRFLR